MVLNWHYWHRLRLRELLRSASHTLRSLNVDPKARLTALETLAAFATEAAFHDGGLEDHVKAGAALQFAASLLPEDVPRLGRIVQAPRPLLLAACASSTHPAVRVWALERAAAAAEETISFALSIGRNDLVAGVRISAAQDEATVASAVQGVKTERLTGHHTLIVDAVAVLVSGGRASLTAPLHDLLTSSLDTSALRPSIVNVARYISGGPAGDGRLAKDG